MPSDLLNLIQTISLEAIKIVVPAVIAAYATYRATTIQFESKLNELDKTNEFHARDRIYSYLKDRIAKVDADTAKLNEEIGRVLGLVLGEKGGEPPTKQIEDFIQVLGGGMMTGAKGVSLEINSLILDMRVAKLDDSEEYKALQAYEKFTDQQVGYASFEELKRSLFLLLEIHNTMEICMRCLLHQQMRCVFAVYIKQ